MSTVVRRKRAKRAVENTAFDAFARRILRAYARRVATGDVDALRSLSMLSSEVDAVVRLAVAGLRHTEDANGVRKVAYSWAEIAGQLGLSRQAAQMRFGEKSERGALDARLTRSGMSVTVLDLAAVFTEHDPGIPVSSLCPGCGFRYPQGVTDCPSRATARPLLFRRRAEDPQAIGRLSPDQLADLHNHKSARLRVAAQSARPAASPAHTAPDLFTANGKELAA
jgi:hypothetical protein